METKVLIGVDPHKATNALAVLDEHGELLGRTEFPADRKGLEALERWAANFPRSRSLSTRTCACRSISKRPTPRRATADGWADRSGSVLRIVGVDHRCTAAARVAVRAGEQLRQWWHELQPPLADRLTGYAHRAAGRWSRSTHRDWRT